LEALLCREGIWLHSERRILPPRALMRSTARARENWYTSKSLIL
jgi:hypothetical protein